MFVQIRVWWQRPGSMKQYAPLGAGNNYTEKLQGRSQRSPAGQLVEESVLCSL